MVARSTLIVQQILERSYSLNWIILIMSAWFVHVVYSTFFMCLIGRGGRAHSLLAKILPSLNNTA